MTNLHHGFNLGGFSETTLDEKCVTNARFVLIATVRRFCGEIRIDMGSAAREADVFPRTGSSDAT